MDRILSISVIADGSAKGIMKNPLRPANKQLLLPVCSHLFTDSVISIKVYRMRSVFFDPGKVLLDFDLTPFFTEIATQTQSDPVTVRTSLSDLFDRYECGEFGDDAFFDELRRITGYSGDESLLGHLRTDIFTPVEKNITLMKALQ